MKKSIRKKSTYSHQKKQRMKPVHIHDVTIEKTERLLNDETYWIEIPVQVGIRYKVSGYIRNQKDENRDAALIIFDFGNYVMSLEQLKMYDLKHSAVGTYAYLPVTDSDVSVWSYDIPIAESMSSLKIGFRTWKNKNPIVLGTQIQIKKDISFAKIYNELQSRTEQNRHLQIAILKERQAAEKVKRTLSFQLGYLLVHSNKSFKNLLNLPYDLYRLSKTWKLAEPDMENETATSFEWQDISEAPISKTLQVVPGNEVELKGKILTSPGEKRFTALVQIEFVGVTVSGESAKRLGLKYSDKIGFYAYLPTDEEGEHDWKIKFRIPDLCRSVKLTLMPWYSSYTIKACILDEVSREKAQPKVAREFIETLRQLWEEKGISEIEKYIYENDLPMYHQADLLEELASLSEDVKQSSSYYLQAYKVDPTYFRAAKMFRRIVDGGYLRTTKTILDDFERKNHAILPADHRNVMYARGYVSLYTRLPNLPDEIIKPVSINSHKVLMFLHTSLPHHSNGYATRSHAILTSMLTNSSYNAIGVTRSGYPFDVGISDFESEDVVDSVRYVRMNAAHYYDQPLDEYMQTAADEAEEMLVSEEPSVIHSASAFYTAFPALIAARRKGLPFVYEVRGLWEITRASTLPGWGETERFKLESELEALVAKEADQVVAITGGLKDELVRRGVDEKKITVIPNAINKEHFQPQTPNMALEKEIGLKEGVPTIGYVGSIVAYEGLDDLVEALSLLKKKGIGFNFLLIGDGNALNGLREQVKEYQLEDEIFIVGRIAHHEVPDYYSLIDITPFPRKPIPVCEMVSPLKPFEAMAQEKAVIASDVAALKEIVSHGQTGLLFKKGNIEDLAEKLELLLTDDALRKELSVEGRKWVLSHRDWSQVAPRFDTVYDKAFVLNEEHLYQKLDQVAKRRPVSLLLYGDLNLNYVDGSAIWAASMVEMLAGFKECTVTFLLKADLTHDTLIESLKKLHNVKIVSPSQTSKGSKLLKPDEAIEVLEEMQKAYSYDGVILRGFELNRLAAQKEVFKGRLWPYMIDIFHIKDEWDAPLVEKVVQIVEASNTVFCQTTHIEAFLHEKIPQTKGKTTLLPPMVPDQKAPKKHFDLSDRALKIVYAGKFAPLWGTREMLSAFKTLRKKGVKVELHVYGDKIHNPPDDKTFKSEVEEALTRTEGIVWHGARPREEVIEAMRTYDLAWAWRRPELEDNTDEISTKFLEYSSVGLPMLVIGNKITTKLLTPEYPLFVNTYDRLVPTIQKIASQPELLKKASELVYEASKQFSFSTVRKTYISPLIDPLSSREKSKIILFAGHDLKFVDKLMEEFAQNGYRVLTDKWQSHNKHNEEKSRELLKRADIIFCEWALGNAVWYSQHKLPFQKLFVRFHRQEIETDYPAQIDYNAVDKMTFIVPHMLRKSIKQYKLDKFKEKCVYIPNYVDAADLDQPKTEDARFNLGIVGIVPKMKRFDRALDILEGLRKKDERYQLFVKGKLAKEYPWMLSRTEEMAYYEAQEKRIENSPHLKGAVHYDGFGKDMGAWFSKIGYILSTSDFEGSHLSVAEAMASGSSPLIIKWDGADEIYPKKYCFDTVSQAVKYVLKETDVSFAEKVVENKVFVEEFDIDNIFSKWKSEIA
ncbi:glycosyltransferase [Sulfurovum sp.]|uniref:glycosyltransferase family 4 protein n=1 Tax=Sulfurovum sp. TaxID=1969726 RepID=UPI0025CE5435|nr:glycosyltransferase [Sulfurovum sp.]